MAAVGEPAFFVVEDFQAAGQSRQLAFVEQIGQRRLIVSLQVSLGGLHDGQNSVRIGPGDSIRIRKASHRLALAMLPGMTFFEVLRQKLKWSGTAV